MRRTFFLFCRFRSDVCCLISFMSLMCSFFFLSVFAFSRFLVLLVDSLSLSLSLLFFCCL